MRTPRRALAAALLVLGATPVSAAAGTAPAPQTGYLAPPGAAAARLEGNYGLSGRVTRAVGVPGERAGQSVQRIWSFISPCPAGACPVLGLHRRRAGGLDALFLRRTAPGVYTASGSYDTGAICAGRLYRSGLRVSFTITVAVIATALEPDGSTLATGLLATYRSTGRAGRTRCFTPPSADAATYLGAPVPS